MTEKFGQKINFLTAQSLHLACQSYRFKPETKESLRYLVTQEYINASYRLGESQNAKVVFVNPGKSTDVVNELVKESVTEEGSNGKRTENGST